MIKFILLLVGAFGCMLPSMAGAQVLPNWMRVQGNYLADQATSAEPSATEPVAEGSLVSARFRQTRARRILAAGVGLVLSAAVTPAYVLPNREPCYASSARKGDAPLKAAAGVGAVGLAAVIGGATWSFIETTRHGYHGSRRQRFVSAGIGALTFLVGQAVLGTTHFADQICST